MKNKKKVLMGLGLISAILAGNGIDSISNQLFKLIGLNNNQTIKKAPCSYVFDSLTGEGFRTCFYGEYYPEVNEKVSNNYDMNSWLRSSIYKESKRYVETKNNKKIYYDIYLPDNTKPTDVIRGIISRVPNVKDSSSTYIEYKESYSYTTGTIEAITIGASIKISLGNELSKLKINFDGNFSHMNEYYRETTNKEEVLYHFDNVKFNNELGVFGIGFKALYYPIRIDTYELCSESGLCKGRKGSYVSERDYVLVPLNQKSIIRYFERPDGYYFDTENGIKPITGFQKNSYYFHHDTLVEF